MLACYPPLVVIYIGMIMRPSVTRAWFLSTPRSRWTDCSDGITCAWVPRLESEIREKGGKILPFSSPAWEGTFPNAGGLGWLVDLWPECVLQAVAIIIGVPSGIVCHWWNYQMLFHVQGPFICLKNTLMESHVTQFGSVGLLGIRKHCYLKLTFSFSTFYLFKPVRNVGQDVKKKKLRSEYPFIGLDYLSLFYGQVIINLVLYAVLSLIHALTSTAVRLNHRFSYLSQFYLNAITCPCLWLNVGLHNLC